MPSQIHKTWLGRAGRTKVEFYGDGHTTRYYFPFPYKRKEHVIVELYDTWREVWIKQHNGGSYRYINDNTIEFCFAPEKISDTQPKIRIRRCTLNCDTEITNKFEPIPEPVTTDPCRGSTDGSNGVLVDDRDESNRPFKVGDTITYTSPCNLGSNVSWYTTPRAGGSATLLKEVDLNGEDKTTSLTIDSTLVDKKLSIRVQCKGCGGTEGLCCEFNGSDAEFESTEILTSVYGGSKPNLSSTATKLLINVEPGNGVVYLNTINPSAAQTYTHTFPNGDTKTHSVAANTAKLVVIKKPTTTSYVTIETGSNTATEYNLSATQAVDTTKYRYARWKGRGWVDLAARPVYRTNLFGQTTNELLYTEPAQRLDYGPWTTDWIEYSGSPYPDRGFDNTFDGFLQLNDAWVNESNGWSGLSVAPYFVDTGDGNNHLKRTNPWQSDAYITNRGSSAQSYGLGLVPCKIGGISKNGVDPDHPHYPTSPIVRFSARQPAVSATIQGFWQFSNSTETDKPVEAAWDGPTTLGDGNPVVPEHMHDCD